MVTQYVIYHANWIIAYTFISIYISNALINNSNNDILSSNAYMHINHWTLRDVNEILLK